MLMRGAVVISLAWPPATAALILSAPEVELTGTTAAGVDRNSLLSVWSGVGSVSVTVEGRTATYSGVLIGRRHVLTAAHVVSGVQPSGIEFILNHGGDQTYRLLAAAFVTHPGYSGFNPHRPNDDLAVIRLVSDVPVGVPLYPLHRAMLARGELLALVGYGGGGNGIDGETVSANPMVKRVGYNRADAFAPDDEGSGTIEVYQFDFDGPDPSTNRMGGLTIGANLEANVSGGDSGSAAFVYDGGQWRLAGINTFQWSAPDGRRGVFGGGGGGMLLSGYAGWIDAAVLARDEPPVRRQYVLAGLGVAGIAGMGLLLALRRRIWRVRGIQSID